MGRSVKVTVSNGYKSYSGVVTDDSYRHIKVLVNGTKGTSPRTFDKLKWSVVYVND